MRETALILVVLIIVGCISLRPVYFDDDKKLAMRAVESFHGAYNREGYHEIFESSDPEAKARKSEQKLADLLTSVHDSVGAVTSSNLVTAKVSVASATKRKVEMVFKTQFERGEVYEMFVVFTDNDQGRLFSWAIPPDEEVNAFLANANK